MNKNSFMIDVNANFYSCICGYGIREFEINILDEQTNNRQRYFKSKILGKCCFKPEFLPCCFGGCSY